MPQDFGIAVRSGEERVERGRNRRRAVIMADHYDTAYREDYYEKDRG